MSVTVSGTVPNERTRPDRCPGVLRPWPADDGAWCGSAFPAAGCRRGSLLALAAVAEEYGDARVRVTGRANLQLRGLPLTDGALPDRVVDRYRGHRPAPVPRPRPGAQRAHLAAHRTGRGSGRPPPVTAELDARLLSDPALAGLPGRFLFTLDDGRGDLADRHRDLGLIALDDRSCQLRVGPVWGRVIDLADAPTALIGLALLFLDRRGSGPTAAWHVEELGTAGQRGITGYRAQGCRACNADDPDPRTWCPIRPVRAGGGPSRPHARRRDRRRHRSRDRRRLGGPDHRGGDHAMARGPDLSTPLAPPPRRYPYVADGPAIYVDSFATIRRESDLSRIRPC